MKHFYGILYFVLLAACSGNPVNTGSPTAAKYPAADSSSKGTAITVPITLTCRLNGKEWQATDISGGHLFYAAGITGMYGDKPYMMLSFRAAAAPDNRQLTLRFKNFQGKTGTYSGEKIEVLLNGSATGDARETVMQRCQQPGEGNSFTVELTEWKAIRVGEAVISGTISGTLKGLMGAPDAKLENGRFDGVLVKIFSDKY